MRILIMLASAVALTACAQVGGDGRTTKAQRHAEPECLVAVDSSKCKFENALAGGHPVDLGQGR